MTTATTATGTAVDGRSTRWAEHRRTRRAELVDAALRAVTRHGPGVGMDDIAAEAGTSKTVLYRHFADKEQLYLAVARRVDERLLRDLSSAVAAADGPRAELAAATATYLRLLERDPDVYRFVVSRPGVDHLAGPDPVTGLTSAIGDALAATITRRLREAGAATTTAGVWAHGLVGMVRAAADAWLAQPPPRPGAAELAGQLTDLAWRGLSAVAAAPRAPAAAPGPAPSATPEETP